MRPTVGRNDSIGVHELPGQHDIVSRLKNLKPKLYVHLLRDARLVAMQLRLIRQMVLEQVQSLGLGFRRIRDEAVGRIYNSALAGSEEGAPAVWMILQFEYGAAVIPGIPETLDIGMAVRQMLHRAARLVRRSAEESWSATGASIATRASRGASRPARSTWTALRRRRRLSVQ